MIQSPNVVIMMKRTGVPRKWFLCMIVIGWEEYQTSRFYPNPHSEALENPKSQA